MSVVAVKIYDKEIIMSADSIIVHGDDKTPVGKGKIVEVNGMLIGSSGFASEAVHMALFAENHTPLAMDEREITRWMYEFVMWRAKEFGVDPKGEYQNCYLIAYKGKAFYCNAGYIGEVTDYFAIGAGDKYANAALYLGHSPAEAVKVACALNCYVAEPIITKSIAK
jgi:ATP-dependent protease HslVU (ClpYQ) peptidase subunit